MSKKKNVALSVIAGMMLLAGVEAVTKGAVSGAAGSFVAGAKNEYARIIGYMKKSAEPIILIYDFIALIRDVKEGLDEKADERLKQRNAALLEPKGVN